MLIFTSRRCSKISTNTHYLTFPLIALLLCLNAQPAQSEDKIVCTRTLEQFGDVKIEGELPYDSGCIYDEMQINGQSYAYAAGMAILAEGYVREKNTKMLLELVDEIYLQHSSLMKEPDEGFIESGKEFSKPSIEAAGSGYRITAWNRMPPPPNAPWASYRASYSLLEVMINENGEIRQREKAN